MNASAAHHPVRGILYMMGALALFALLDTISKSLASRHPVAVVVWGRYFAHFLITLVVFLPRHGTALFKTRRPGLQVVRGMTLLGTTGAIVMAFQHMPLAEVTALVFVAPFLVMMLAVVFLGEKVAPWRWLPVVVGFSGVLLIARPSGSAFNVGVVSVLAGACCYAVYQILTRKLSAVDRSVTQLFYAALVGAATMCVLVPWFWVPGALDLRDWLMIGSLGVLGASSHLLMIMALRAAPATTLSPFTYAQLVWATLLGWLVFGDFPGSMSLAGMLIIVASGVVVAYSERFNRKA
ncbi:DMT family transporter [Aromatoleum anaerobium]|uniref:EamA family transporter n=1 Tax=Aromatoleum anaerobium TaxID=182180 RepID=A0ABX1PU43_9RHOO|nr:DMT family transporter [Aromatoleum anaerobium]MCK0506583.1 DMT family transporter [Aromatoleum anaerobium]